MRFWRFTNSSRRPAAKGGADELRVGSEKGLGFPAKAMGQPLGGKPFRGEWLVRGRFFAVRRSGAVFRDLGD